MSNCSNLYLLQYGVATSAHDSAHAEFNHCSFWTDDFKWPGHKSLMQAFSKASCVLLLQECSDTQQ